MTRRPRRVVTVVGLVVGLALVAWMAPVTLGPNASDDEPHLRIAVPVDPSDHLLRVALEAGSFSDKRFSAEAVRVENDAHALATVRAGRADLAAVGMSAFARDLAARDGRVADDDPTIAAAIALVADPDPSPDSASMTLSHRVVVARRADLAEAPDRYARAMRALASALDAAREGASRPRDDPPEGPHRDAARAAATTIDLNLDWSVLAALIAENDRLRAAGEPAWPADGPILAAFDPRPLDRSASAAPVFPWLPPHRAEAAP